MPKNLNLKEEEEEVRGSGESSTEVPLPEILAISSFSDWLMIARSCAFLLIQDSMGFLPLLVGLGFYGPF